MYDIAHDTHFETLERALLFPNGVEVEQRLRGMLVLAIARIDHGRIGMLRDHIRCARVLMAHDEHVDLHRIERLDGVDKALALDRGRGRTTCVDRIAGKTLLGQLERSARAR